jgi:hypothetical protein
MRRPATLSRTDALVLVFAAIAQPNLVVADHAPDNLSQDVDPNYVACLMAVDDADLLFLNHLQNACFARMVEVCMGRVDASVPSLQAIDCITFENRRSIAFMQDALGEMPTDFEFPTGFKGTYQRRRDSILKDLESVKNSPQPKTIDEAVKQGVVVAVSASLLFYLARETETPMEALVASTFGNH